MGFVGGSSGGHPSNRLSQCHEKISGGEKKIYILFGQCFTRTTLQVFFLGSMLAYDMAVIY